MTDITFMKTTMKTVDITNMSEAELDAMFDAATEETVAPVMVLSRKIGGNMHHPLCEVVSKLALTADGVRRIVRNADEIARHKTDIAARGAYVGVCRCISRAATPSMRMGG